MTECRAGDSAPGDGGVEADAAQRGAAPSDGPATVSAAPALAEASDERDSDDAQVDTDEPQVCAAAWSAPAPSDSTSRPPSARTNRRFTVTRLEEGGLESPPPLPRPPPLFLPSLQDLATQFPTPAATIPTPVLAPIPGSPSAHIHTPAPAADSTAPADPDGWDYGPDIESAAAPAPAPAPAPAATSTAAVSAAAGTAAGTAAVTSAGWSGVPAVSSSALAVPAAPACRCSPSAGRGAPVVKTVTVVQPLAKPVAQRVFAVAPAVVPAGVPVAAGSRVPPAGPTRYYATIQPGLGGLPASALYQPTQRQPLLVTGHSATLAAGLAGSARLQQALQSRLAAGTDSVHPRLQPSHPLYRRLAGVGEYNPAHTISYGHSDGRQLTVRRLLDWEPPDLHTVRKYTSDAESESDAGSVLSVVPTHRGARGRTTWTNKVEFILACLGYAVGLGNLWRFPYLCYKSGGGAFFIPYLIMMVVCSIPILLMELTIGQFTRQGPVGAMGRLCPLLKGAGVAPVVISFIFCTYYNVVIGWALYYLFSSFSSELPWTFCNNTWNTPSCEGYISRGEGGISLPSNYTSSPVGGNRSAVLGDSGVNQTDAIAAALATTPEEEYFSRRVLAISSGVSDLGTVRIPLMLTLLLAWVLVYFSIWKSIRSSGKVVYVTVIAPYLLLTAFLWRALTLEGASTGIRYLFQPHWSLLADSKVWVNALAQNFNSVGIGFGSMITFASYNKFENRTILLDTTVIILANLLTSVFAGIIVFATLGNIAMELDRPIQKVVVDGPGLVYVVYPKALASMPFPQLWSVLFFFMLLCLGLDSQFATLEVVITSLQDGYSGLVKKYLKRHELLVLVICLLSFGLGLPYVTQGGMYVFQLVDYNVTNTSLILLALFEVGTVAWVYGTDRLSQDFLAMTGRQISGYFLVCLKFLAPMLILAIWVFSLIDHEPLTYGPYDYPEWAYHLGWLLVALPVLPIPVCAGLALWRAPGNTLLERLKASVQPDRRVRRDLGYEPTVDGPDLSDHPGLYYEMSPMSAHAQIPYSAVNGDADSK